MTVGQGRAGCARGGRACRMVRASAASLLPSPALPGGRAHLEHFSFIPKPGQQRLVRGQHQAGHLWQ